MKKKNNRKVRTKRKNNRKIRTKRKNNRTKRLIKSRRNLKKSKKTLTKYKEKGWVSVGGSPDKSGGGKLKKKQRKEVKATLLKRHAGEGATEPDVEQAIQRAEQEKEGYAGGVAGRAGKILQEILLEKKVTALSAAGEPSAAEEPSDEAVEFAKMARAAGQRRARRKKGELVDGEMVINWHPEETEQEKFNDVSELQVALVDAPLDDPIKQFYNYRTERRLTHSWLLCPLILLVLNVNPDDIFKPENVKQYRQQAGSYFDYCKVNAKIRGELTRMVGLGKGRRLYTSKEMRPLMGAEANNKFKKDLMKSSIYAFIKRKFEGEKELLNPFRALIFGGGAPRAAAEEADGVRLRLEAEAAAKREEEEEAARVAVEEERARLAAEEAEAVRLKAEEERRAAAAEAAEKQRAAEAAAAAKRQEEEEAAEAEVMEEEAAVRDTSLPIPLPSSMVSRSQLALRPATCCERVTSPSWRTRNTCSTAGGPKTMATRSATIT